MIPSICFSQLQNTLINEKNPQFPCEVGTDYCPHFSDEDMRYRGIRQQS